MSSSTARRLRLAALVLAAILLLACGWFYLRLRASLPQLDGPAGAPGLKAAVVVERDALGIPTISGSSRADVVRALGWLHAQDRFFQMDLLRRGAAGELAELLGPRALPRDRETRRHGFRRIAQAVVARLSPEERAALDAYVAGVNHGLAALGARPFEYLALRETPQPWHPEDSILAGYSIALDMQGGDGGYERTLMTLRDRYGFDSLAFFAPLLTPDDAALDDSRAPLPPIPGPRMIDLRERKTGAITPPPSTPFAPLGRDPLPLPGSNAIALSGKHTASGAGLLANDMHLALGVPNTWYRTSLAYDGRKITGLTLPGIPAVIAGSNGHVAWGFTNACADTSDLVIVETNSIAPNLYKAPGRDDFLSIERRQETIHVRGGDPVTVEYPWTIWGPIVGTNDRQRPLALRWIVHDPEATNLRLMDMEAATTVPEALAVARRAGITTVNIVIADRAGEIAWSLAGPLPRRVGYDGRLPVTWNFGDRKWDGLLAEAETPVVRGASSSIPGRLWSANQRHIGGEALTRLGDGGYARPARAAQLRDALAPLSRATPRDLLALQLDDRALFLQPWHRLLLDTLKTSPSGPRATLRAKAEKWEGRASIDAMSYRIVREFRDAVRARLFGPIFEPCLDAYPGFLWQRLNLEPATWAILREKPAHLLHPRHSSWDDLLSSAIDDTIVTLEKSNAPEAPWGERNRARIRHPFSHAFPLIGRWLDLPPDPLPGDHDMPRVQTPSHGASERFVVSPSREEEGLCHMPGGQSGHPLSPFFRAGHDAWVRGEPTPFLPGPIVHRLTLQP